MGGFVVISVLIVSWERTLGEVLRASSALCPVAARRGCRARDGGSVARDRVTCFRNILTATCNVLPVIRQRNAAALELGRNNKRSNPVQFDGFESTVRCGSRTQYGVRFGGTIQDVVKE